MQVRYNEIVSDSAYLDEVLAEGASKASSIADVTLNNVYQAMGFFRRWTESSGHKRFSGTNINATTTFKKMVASRCL